MSGYGRDLAYVHDTGFSGFSESAAPWILSELRRAGLKRGRVVDLGCGGGAWARRLLDAGYDVLGVDRSAALLEHARRRAPEATFVRASFLRARLPTCVGVTALGEVLNYRFDPGNDDAALRKLFARVYGALVPGGLFLFDLAGPGRVPPPGPARSGRAGSDWAVVSEANVRGRVLTRTITSFVRFHGPHYRRSVEVHELRLHEPAAIARALRDVGFTVSLHRSYGGEGPRLPGLTVFRARK